MPRRFKSKAGQPASTDAELAMQSFVGPVRGRRKRGAGANRKAHIEEVRDRIARQDWADMTVGKLVALYWICHEKVYGVTPVEIDKAAVWERAMKAAGTMVKDHFDGDVQRAVVFMRWAWGEADRKEKWAISKRKNVRRISWQNQFQHDYMITDWRAAGMRSRGTG